jgi:hypothetical protein
MHPSQHRRVQLAGIQQCLGSGRCGGLTPEWVRVLILPDLLFVKSEWVRYDFASWTLGLRRNKGLLEEEEIEWAKMFTEGIYYANVVRVLPH